MYLCGIGQKRGNSNGLPFGLTLRWRGKANERMKQNPDHDSVVVKLLNVSAFFLYVELVVRQQSPPASDFFNSDHHLMRNRCPLPCSTFRLETMPLVHFQHDKNYTKNSFSYLTDRNNQTTNNTNKHKIKYPTSFFAKMDNTDMIYLNNAAIDALHAGDITKGFKILSQTFEQSVRERHHRHNLKATRAATLEFCLQDCSRNLERALHLRNTISDDSCQFLCLNFLRMEIPSDKEERQVVNQLCNCAIAWALRYNISIVYTIMGFQRNLGAANIYFKRALRILQPIKRQVMLQESKSAFWTNLKLCILNNDICIQREVGNPVDVVSSVKAMETLLLQSRRHLDPMDVKKYYLSMHFLNLGTSVAAAA